MSFWISSIGREFQVFSIALCHIAIDRFFFAFFSLLSKSSCASSKALANSVSSGWQSWDLAGYPFSDRSSKLQNVLWKLLMAPKYSCLSPNIFGLHFVSWTPQASWNEICCRCHKLEAVTLSKIRCYDRITPVRVKKSVSSDEHVIRYHFNEILLVLNFRLFCPV